MTRTRRCSYGTCPTGDSTQWKDCYSKDCPSKNRNLSCVSGVTCGNNLK